MSIIDIDGADAWGQALKKAENPNMLLDSNPLYNASSNSHSVIDSNMRRLKTDAQIRSGIHGSVYSGIMSTRFQGGK